MAPKWRHGSILEVIMPVSLSIKDVPEALAARLRERAARNHRSLQRELMAIAEAAVAPANDAPRHSVMPPAIAAWTPDSLPASANLNAAAATRDDLLAELDAIVAGSRWGGAPLLSREQSNDRRLMRELDFEEQQGRRP